MAEKNRTIFQTLSKVIGGGSGGLTPPPAITNRRTVQYNINPDNDILFSTKNRAEFEQKKLQAQQDKLLAMQWYKAGIDLAATSNESLTNIQLMYRDADLMEVSTPEIGTALEIVAEEACMIGSTGKMLNISSKSDRIKAILEDLFYNRLDLHVTLPMVTKDTAKYGNEFMLLNINSEDGITGWRRLPPYEMQRLENGITNPYMAVGSLTQVGEIKPDETKFLWVGKNVNIPYQNWQVAHFRLINDSTFLPYGCIVGDTRIETENGYKEIDSINIGDRVWTFDVEKQEKVLSTVTMGAFKGVKDVYSVKTWHNFIEGTDDHKLLCYEDEKLIYKEIKDINVGDLLVIDNSSNKQNTKVKIDKSSLTENEANLKKSTLWWEENISLIPDYVDEDFAEFFGFMIGDGWVDSKHSVTFATGEYDTFNKKFYDYLKKLTGKEPTFVKGKNKTNYEFSQVRVYSKTLKIILERMGFSGKFNEKRVPSWVYSCEDSIKKSFLNGLMIADGSYNIDKYGVLRCSIEMSNEQLVKDIKILVQSLGYKSGQIGFRNRASYSKLSCGRKIQSKQTSYYFYYFETENEQEKKYDLKNRIGCGFKTETVRSKEYVGKKKTYDITVDNNNSNFFANGIVTHNCSWLHKARRSWRMLTMMEDMMLIYRLERSIERRVFKIYTGAIDDKDVPAYMQQVANQFKRTPIIDPQTGQIDLRKNFASVDSDYFIPFRTEDTASKIESLPSAQNPTAMDDIEYVRQHLLAALRVPKAFLNFTDPAQNKGQNLSIMDIRFSRMINRVQQALLMELNKIAIIHLLLLGFTDDVMNFTLTMNNPSSQVEMQELDALTKRVQTAQTLLADPGNGIQIYSYHRVLKEILHMSDTEIADNLNEIRLEKALAAELQLTQQVIKKTGIFDPTDRIYGDPEAKYDYSSMEEGGEGGPGGGAGGGMPGGDLGGAMGGVDSLGGPEGGDVGGAEESMGMDAAPAADAGETVAENKNAKKNLITELIEHAAGKKGYIPYFEQYINKITKEQREDETSLGRVETVSDSFVINEELNSIVGELDAIISEGTLEEKAKAEYPKIEMDDEILTD